VPTRLELSANGITFRLMKCEIRLHRFPRKLLEHGKMASKSLGNRILELRNLRGLSQTTLAGRLDVSSTAVWNWEQNGVNPRPAMLKKLAKALSVSEAYLLTGKDAPPQSRTAAQIIRAAAEEIAALNGVPVSKVHIDWRIGN
jgi:transcriptional regulator with XRE-family HTH domain